MLLKLLLQKNEELPKINTILYSKETGSHLMVKKIVNDFELYAVLISTMKPLYVGQDLQNTKKSFMVPVGEESKNHIFDVNGNSLTNPEAKLKRVEMDSTIYANSNFTTKPQILETGIKAIDFFIPVLSGAKIGLFGGAGVGKTVLMKEVIFTLSKKDKKNNFNFHRSRRAFKRSDWALRRA